VRRALSGICGSFVELQWSRSGPSPEKGRVVGGDGNSAPVQWERKRTIVKSLYEPRLYNALRGGN